MARLNYNEENWQDVLVRGIRCQFSDMRIDRDTVPEGKFQYEVADGDSDGIPTRIRPGIMVNFFGTLISNTPLPVDEGDTTWLMEGDWIWQ